MSYRSLIAAVLGLNLFVGSALALTPPATSKAINAKIPAAPGSAIFVNVKRIFSLYGDLITSTPQWQKVTAEIQKGMPDPSKDLDEVAIALDLVHASSSNA